MTDALYYKYWGKVRSDNENGAISNLSFIWALDVQHSEII
jgi:hypothetical protein